MLVETACGSLAPGRGNARNGKVLEVELGGNVPPAVAVETSIGY